MATRLYLTDVAELGLSVAGYVVLQASLTRGSGNASNAYTTGGSFPQDMTDDRLGGTGLLMAWAFRTGTAYSTNSANDPSLHAWCSESNAMGNYGLQCVLHLNTTAIDLATIGTVTSEFGTSSAAFTHTMNATSGTSVAVGDWLIIRPRINSSGGTAASGFVAQFDYGATSVGATGDTYVDLVETIVQYSAPAASYIPRSNQMRQVIAQAKAYQPRKRFTFLDGLWRPDRRLVLA